MRPIWDTMGDRKVKYGCKSCDWYYSMCVYIRVTLEVKTEPVLWLNVLLDETLIGLKLKNIHVWK